jgi:hypothetical protein
VDIAKRIFVHQDSTFAEKYVHSMGQTDSDLVKVIDITDDDFKLIKKVRDRIAHGDHPGLQEGEFTRIDAVVRKIALLLTYWTLHDLGLSKAEFLGAMNATHNRLYLGASVDRKSLARATGTAAFFNVSAEMFEWLASRKDLRFDACFIEGPAGAIELSEEYTARWKSWHTNPPREPVLFQWKTIFEVEGEAIKHHGTVYIESRDRTLQLSSVCIFDKSKLPSWRRRCISRPA